MDFRIRLSYNELLGLSNVVFYVFSQVGPDRTSLSVITPLFSIILCQLFRTSTFDTVATIGSVSNYRPSYPEHPSGGGSESN